MSCWQAAATAAGTVGAAVAEVEQSMNQKAELWAEFDRVGGVEPAVGQAFDPLSPDEIRSLAADFGGPLPDSLELYLREFGAVGFSKDVFYRPVRPFPLSYSRNNIAIVSLLFGRINPAYPKARHLSIARKKLLLKDVLSGGLMPFADNGAGDFLFVQLNGDSHGAVYLWDHETPDAENFYFVNGSFDAWLDSLSNTR